MFEMRSEKLDLNNQNHREIALEIYKKHSKWFIDDSVDSFERLLLHLDYLINATGDIGFIFFVNDLPYGLIFASFDRYNNAVVEASAINNHNFFISHKIFKYFIEYLFEIKKVNKIKSQIYVWNSNAELMCKVMGFKKEGILREELHVNGKPINLLQLAITKSDYVRNGIARISRDRLKQIMRVLKNV